MERSNHNGKTVWLAGGSGLIGTVLAPMLLAQNFHVVIITRKINQDLPYTQVEWGDLSLLDTPFAVVNLCGSSVNARPTDNLYKTILESRLESISALAEYFSLRKEKPQVWIQASSLSIYGHHSQRVFKEDSSLAPSTLSLLYQECERRFIEKLDKNIRGVILRIPYVISLNGGYLTAIKMLLEKRINIVGDGRQWVSWVHEEDMAGIILHALNNEQVVGVFNANSSHFISQRDFSQSVDRVMNYKYRAHWRLPAKLFYFLAWVANKNPNMMLDGRKADNSCLLNTNFQFIYDDLDAALRKTLL